MEAVSFAETVINIYQARRHHVTGNSNVPVFSALVQNQRNNDKRGIQKFQYRNEKCKIPLLFCVEFFVNCIRR